MDWKDWIGKDVFLRTKSSKVFNGKIISIDSKSNPLVFITLIDKFGNNVMILNSEILELKEARNAMSGMQ